MPIFKNEGGLKYEFEKRWQRSRTTEFPHGKTDMVDKYKQLEDRMNEKYHPDVNLGAAAAGDGILTDHGVPHVNMVMHNAWRILDGKIKQLSGYEIFLLLVAIHFHDVGNILGREEHEQKITDIMLDLGDTLQLETPEQILISAIAMAHGGHVCGNPDDKDTIRRLEDRTDCNGIFVRPAMLAAVLRFADELSEDFTRAKNIETMPEENKIYHEFSNSLERIGIDGKTVILRFSIPYSKTKERIRKGASSIFLYDEILLRLGKCLRELEYCRKFAVGFIDITTLSVTIKVEDPHNRLRIFGNEIDCFQLGLIGYPRVDLFCLENYVMGEKNDGGQIIPKTLKYTNGQMLRNIIMEKEAQQNA